MRLIITEAVGGREWGDMALNLALSIKTNDPEQKVGVIYTDSAFKGIEPLQEKFFDYGWRVNEYDFGTSYEQAFYLKTQLYQIAFKMCPEATEVIYMDADTLMIPGRSTAEWFEAHKDKQFTAYCNDMYDFKTKKRRRSDYTFWCDPEVVKEPLDLKGKLPQINTSFMYFNRTEEVRILFDAATEFWNDETLPYKKYKGVKPDEFCFNLASCETGLLPHKNTYRPIFMQFASENQDEAYILQHYKAIGFAGEIAPSEQFIVAYNKYVKHYRTANSVMAPFTYDRATKGKKDNNPIQIKPTHRRTMFRRSELGNSDGGIFNPDCLVLTGNRYMEIVRKEPTFKDGYGESGVAHVRMFNNLTETDYELSCVGYPENKRIEDFRLFMCGQAILCNHTIASNTTTTNREAKCALAYVSNKDLNYIGIPALPIETKAVEKNWVFFGEGNRMWCIYSISPYIIFYADAESGWQEWIQHGESGGNLKWFHYNQFICNSTNPIAVGDYWLMFFHTKEQGAYYHGAVLIDRATKEIKHYTKNSLTIDSNMEGMQKGLIYVSGSAYFREQNKIRIYFGEGDSHACYNDYNAEYLINTIINNRV